MKLDYLETIKIRDLTKRISRRSLGQKLAFDPDPIFIANKCAP